MRLRLVFRQFASAFRIVCESVLEVSRNGTCEGTPIGNSKTETDPQPVLRLRAGVIPLRIALRLKYGTLFSPHFLTQTPVFWRVPGVAILLRRQSVFWIDYRQFACR